MALSSCFLCFILCWAPQIIQLSLLLPLFFFGGKRGEARGLIQGDGEKSWASFFSRMGGPLLAMMLSNVVCRGDWHSWMSMRKPKANSGSPHTLRDVRFTPKLAVASLDLTKEEEGSLPPCCLCAHVWKEPWVHPWLFLWSLHIYARTLHIRMCMWSLPGHRRTQEVESKGLVDGHGTLLVRKMWQGIHIGLGAFRDVVPRDHSWGQREILMSPGD